MAVPLLFISMLSINRTCPHSGKPPEAEENAARLSRAWRASGRLSAEELATILSTDDLMRAAAIAHA